MKMTLTIQTGPIMSEEDAKAHMRALRSNYRQMMQEKRLARSLEKQELLKKRSLKKG